MNEMRYKQGMDDAKEGIPSQAGDTYYMAGYGYQYEKGEKESHQCDSELMRTWL